MCEKMFARIIARFRRALSDWTTAAVPAAKLAFRACNTVFYSNFFNRFVKYEFFEHADRAKSML